MGVGGSGLRYRYEGINKDDNSCQTRRVFAFITLTLLSSFYPLVYSSTILRRSAYRTKELGKA